MNDQTRAETIRQHFQPIDITNDEEGARLADIRVEYTNADDIMRTAITNVLEANQTTKNKLMHEMRELWVILGKRYGLDIENHQYNIKYGASGNLSIIYIGPLEKKGEI